MRMGKTAWIDVANSTFLSPSEAEQARLSSISKEIKTRDPNPSRRGKSEVQEQHINSSVPLASMSDTYIGKHSLQAALCAAGTACRAVDIIVKGVDTNVFVCTRPPGHHAGRFGCTPGAATSTGFCLLNNAAICAVYARVRWGFNRVAVVDIDVHMGNGTAELLKGDPRAFFASVHMIYGEENNGVVRPRPAPGVVFESTAGELESSVRNEVYSGGFYPAKLGRSELSDNYLSLGVFPEDLSFDCTEERHNEWATTGIIGAMDIDVTQGNLEAKNVEGSPPSPHYDTEVKADGGADGAFNSASQAENALGSDSSRTLPVLKGSKGYRRAISDYIIPYMEKFDPELLIISAGFDGFSSDPLGGNLNLTLEDFVWATNALVASLSRPEGSGAGRVVSLLEGGYDTSPQSLGLAKCVDAHVLALRGCCKNI